MRITSKAEFFQLWEAGVLGNRLRIWRDPKQALADGGFEICGLREVGKAGGGRLDIVPAGQLLATAAEWDRAGRRYVICEAAPDEVGTLQGEVCRGVGGWHGLLGLSRGLRMREAAAAGLLEPCRGVQVVDALNRWMDPASRDDLEALLDLYPDATVEFTCYEKMVGALPGRNTIFWEVRNY